ncbi:MAG: NAD-dependent epimerase/dehydratase family protein [Candidatus Niyogibacteria bacterium]|nr:NAD-dependent epimerase/dehydratase family protein [Candidatus Niyogibacteria bacterium]
MDNLKGKKVLVTGGAGFIGSHIIDRCAEAEEMEVYSVDNRNPAYKNLKACYMQADITNQTAMNELFNLVRPDFVVHCAALARIQPSFERLDDYFRINIFGTKIVLEMSKNFNVKRFVFASSSSIYGLQKYLPLAEDMPVFPLTPYAYTKHIGEELCRFMGKMTGGPETVILRYFNVYGPRQPKTFDYYGTIIGIFMEQKKQNIPFTVVFDGNQRRDFTHVYDVAEANILAMVSPKIGQGEIINIGFGKNHSVFDVCIKILCAKKTDLKKNETFLQLEEGKDFVFIAPRRGEARAVLADNSKAKKLLDWIPKISLSEGIKMC